MIWINKSQANIQQVEVMHQDVCSVTLTLGDQKIFLASVYLPCNRGSRIKDNLRLEKRLDLLRQAFLLHKRHDKNLELVITGDFNRWDSLWRGSSLTAHTRQGEGQFLIDLMSDLDLQLLLPCGTTTYTGVTQNGYTSSTIDLVFSTPRLAAERLVCKIHETDHGSDHSAIETFFAINQPIPTCNAGRGLFKNASWEKVQNEVSNNLTSLTATSAELDFLFHTTHQHCRTCHYHTYSACKAQSLC